MLFSVIYSFQCPLDIPVKRFHPPHYRNRKLWEMTEAHTEDEFKHRKWCALLTRKQFDEFVERLDLNMSTTETMGSIGPPGFGISWAPAHMFENEGDVDAWLCAYVTPVPEFSPRRDLPEEEARKVGSQNWDRIKRAMLNVYGNGY